MRDRCAFYFGDDRVNELYLVVIDYGNEPFVLQKTRKVKGLHKVAEDLSYSLFTIVSIIKATLLNGEYKTEPIYVVESAYKICGVYDEDGKSLYNISGALDCKPFTSIEDAIDSAKKLFIMKDAFEQIKSMATIFISNQNDLNNPLVKVSIDGSVEYLNN